MFILSLLWVLIGLLIGVLANGARLWPASWGRRGWLYLPGVGVLLALLGGWLGTLLQGALFATATAIWVTAAGVVLVAWLGKYFRRGVLKDGRKQTRAAQAPPPHSTPLPPLQ